MTDTRSLPPGVLPLSLFSFSVALFWWLPELDLAASGWFFDPDRGGFFLKDQLIVRAVFLLFDKIHLALLILLPVLAVAGYRLHRKEHHRKWIFTFLLLSLLLGPGLLANTLLKNNSTGRARPAQVEQFGGERHFTPAFVYSGQCQTNCSFVSGHAAMGFYFCGLGWLFRSRRAFLAGCLIGTLVGTARIAQGSHFVSDVLFAFWVVYFVNCGLARLLRLCHPLHRRAAGEAHLHPHHQP